MSFHEWFRLVIEIVANNCEDWHGYDLIIAATKKGRFQLYYDMPQRWTLEEAIALASQLMAEQAGSESGLGGSSPSTGAASKAT